MNTEMRSPRSVARVACFWLLPCGALATLVLILQRPQSIASIPRVVSKPLQQMIDNSGATVFVETRTQTLRTKGDVPLAIASAASRAKVLTTYGKLPLRFEVNQGQTNEQVKFVSRGRGYSLFLTEDQAVLRLRSLSALNALSTGHGLQFKELFTNPEASFAARDSRTSPPPPSTVRMKLVGASPQVSVAAFGELLGNSNYFIGNDPKKWQAQIPAYSKVRYKSVYPGVDLVYHGEQGQLEYDFLVAPGADPRAIALEITSESAEIGAKHNQVKTNARINAHGDLVLRVESGEVRFRKPVVYQQISNSGHQSSRRYIDTRYIIKQGDYIGFEMAKYDTAKSLIIDPVLSYSTYLGGALDDFGNAITVDVQGNIYVTGGTTSSNYRTTAGVVQTKYAGADGGYQSVDGDVFVTELNPSGSALVFSTYLGGSGDDNAYGIVVDGPGNIYLTGGTNSSDFPVTPGVYQPSFGGLTDVFVTKLNPSGSSLVYSTHIGVSTEGIRGFGIAVDDTGSAYVTGNAGPGFPTTSGAYQTGSGAFTSAYVMKLNPTASAADYSTFLSGGAIDYGESIAVDLNHNAYVTGYASSSSFPTTAGAFQTINGGGVDAFVTVLNPAGNALVYSTLLGGTGSEEGFKIALDPLGKVYVTGFTGSANFPTTSGALQTTFGGGNSDAFVAKLDTSKSGAASLVYSTFLGGSGDENAQNFLRDILAVDNAGNAYVTGATTSKDFPTVNPLQTSSGGGYDAYVAKLNAAGSRLIYSTYLGGSGDDFGRGIALDSHENVYVTGQTFSTNFPITSDSFQAAFGGFSDAFMAKLIPISFLPATLAFGNQNVGSTSPAQTITLINEKNATALNIGGITSSGDFAEKDTCGTSVAAGQQCTVSVTFVPTLPGSRTGSITLKDDASNSPQTVTLSGTGIGPFDTFSTASISLGSQLVTTSGSAQVATLTNNGNAPLTITSIAVSSTNSGDFTQTNTCPGSNATLAVNASCTISVIFTPTVAGNRSGSVTITDNAPSSPHVLALSGTGTDYSLVAATGSNCPAGGNCSTSASIMAGQPATYDLQVTPSNGFNGTVALTCKGAAGASTCSISPPSVTPNGGASSGFVVTVSNTANVMVTPLLRMPFAPAWPAPYLLLAVLCVSAAMLVSIAGSAGPQRRRALVPGLALLLLGWAYVAACGGGGPTVPAPTNATLTITGASGGTTRTVPLTLTVNH